MNAVDERVTQAPTLYKEVSILHHRSSSYTRHTHSGYCVRDHGGAKPEKLSSLQELRRSFTRRGLWRRIAEHIIHRTAL